MVKDVLVGVKMTKEMYKFLGIFALDEGITVPEVIRKVIKKVMAVWED